MNTDRELLEWAALAAGYTYSGYLSGIGLMVKTPDAIQPAAAWNPLTDDGDALRLAIKLRIHVGFYEEEGDPGVVQAVAYGIDGNRDEGWTYTEGAKPDPYAAARRAIVRAAAELGRQMEGGAA